MSNDNKMSRNNSDTSTNLEKQEIETTENMFEEDPTCDRLTKHFNVAGLTPIHNRYQIC